MIAFSCVAVAQQPAPSFTVYDPNNQNAQAGCTNSPNVAINWISPTGVELVQFLSNYSR
jgi:flagellar basal body rod protein FlgC